MSVRKLRTLIEVAATGSFSAAAERVFITHAAVSQQMKSLEQEFGVELFDRSSRRPILTPQGRMITERAHRLIQDYDTLTQMDNDPGLNGEINLGAVRTTLSAVIPNTLAGMAKDCPNLDIHVVPGMTMQLVEQVERGMIDLALISRPRVLKPGLNWRVVARENLTLIAPANITTENIYELLANKPFIRFSRQAIIGGDIESWLHSKSIRVQDRMELENIEVICSMVELGLGVSIVPFNSAYMKKSRNIRYIELGDDIGVRELGTISREDGIKKTAILALEDKMQNICHRSF